MQTNGRYVSNKPLARSLICIWRVICHIPWLLPDSSGDVTRGASQSDTRAFAVLNGVSNTNRSDGCEKPPHWRLCSLCRRGFFSPPLLGRQRCSWWILKQISLIIVFHNCHAERDCPLRSYLCHCTHTPHACTPPPPSLYRLFNKTQITTEIVKSTSKIIKSKWRIYRWHFITINLRHLINKPTPLAPPPPTSPSSSLKLSCLSGMKEEGSSQDGCQGRHGCHSFWLMEHRDPAPNPPSIPACPLSPLQSSSLPNNM